MDEDGGAIEAELVCDAVGREGVARAIGIGGRVRIEWVGGEITEIFGMNRERDEKEETGEQKCHAAPPDGPFSLALGWAGRQVRLATVIVQRHPEQPKAITQYDAGESDRRPRLTQGEGSHRRPPSIQK